jgi:hypothetical protein
VKLPELPRLSKTVEDDGRVFKGFYQFTANTQPGVPHRIWVRVNTGKNTAGMALMVQKAGGWVQAGIRTKNSGNGANFLTFYFEVPENLIQSDKTVFRLVAENGTEVNTYHLWVFQLASKSEASPAELLGFPINQTVGQVEHGLIPKGPSWQKPLVLNQNPSQAALLMQKIGKGTLIRSELNLADSLSLMTTLLNPAAELGSTPTVAKE